MPHATHKARRVQVSSVDGGAMPKRDPGRQRLLMALGVGFSMLIIAALYAASFKYQRLFQNTAKDFPRWSALSETFFREAAPITDELSGFKNIFVAKVRTAKIQVDTVRLMQEKIAARAAASASATPATP